jgi:hypothetical protein
MKYRPAFDDLMVRTHAVPGHSFGLHFNVKLAPVIEQTIHVKTLALFVDV